MNAIDMPAPRGLMMLAITELDVSSAFQQRRTRVPAQADEGLVVSIRGMGVLTPILVHWNPDAERHQVVDGHRRVAAAAAAGLSVIPAVELQGDERASLAAGVAANTQRAPLAPVDLWRAIVHLQGKGWTLDGAAGALGIAKRTAQQIDKLGRLHPSMLSAIEQHHMPEEEELAIIAGAPHDVQAAALANPNAWDDDHDQAAGTGTVMKVPNWWDIANLCRVRRIPQSRAIFDTTLIDIAWVEDMFAQPDDADRFTTSDIEGFLSAQITALTIRSNRTQKLRSVEWDKKANRPTLPVGWTHVFDHKTVGAERFAAVQPDGHSIGCVVEIYAVPPAPKAGAKGKAAEGGDQAAAATNAAADVATAEGATETDPADPSSGDGSGGEDRDERLGGTFGSGDAPAPMQVKSGRGPLTEAGRILVAQAKTTAIRCALRDRRDHQPGDLLMVLVLALCGSNVTVLGDPASKYVRTSFIDLAARLVAPDGTENPELSGADIMAIAAEAAARMIVCDPTGAFGNSSGAAAEWIGRILEAHRDMPRLDTAEILATASGDTLRDAAKQAGMKVGGSSKALRERLAGNAEGMTLPGSTFAAPGPPRATRRPDGHVGPFPCVGCDAPQDCIGETACFRVEDGGG